MQTVENYLLNKASKLRADNTYISDGNILIKKDNLDNEFDLNGLLVKVDVERA